MRIYPFFSVHCVVLLLCFSACKKPESIPTQSTYTFINQTGQRVHLDLYGSQADYNQNTSAIAQYNIATDSAQKVVVDVGKTYWMDWYSDDFTFNNWAPRSNASNLIQFDAADVDDNRVLAGDQTDTIRSIMLNGNQVSTTWKGATKNSGAAQGTHQFTFRKDFTGEHRFTDLSGNLTVESFIYALSSLTRIAGKSTSFRIQLSNAQNSLFLISCNLQNFQPLTGRDSLLVDASDGSTPEFTIARQ